MITIYRPIKTNRKTQGFGDNIACSKIGVRPFQVVTKQGQCPAGYQDFYKALGMLGHNGEDWATWHGEPLYHGGDYVGVMKSEIDSDGGIGVNIISKDKHLIDGEMTYIKLKYWHLKAAIGYDGKIVNPGDMIGLCDSTGASSGDHLHWSLKPCDSKGNNTDPGNGYYGAVDFTPYFKNEFIVDVIDGIKEQVLTLTDQTNKLIFQVQQWIKGRS